MEYTETVLNEGQTRRVWEKMVEAEVRSFYFADLASRYTRYKQIISGATFFLSSGAAASVIGRSPNWVPVVLALLSALASAYSIAVGLDRRASALAKLHADWNALQSGYERLWNHWYEDSAEQTWEELRKQAHSVSDRATTEAPRPDDKLIDEWAKTVYSRYGQAAA